MVCRYQITSNCTFKDDDPVTSICARIALLPPFVWIIWNALLIMIFFTCCLITMFTMLHAWHRYLMIPNNSSKCSGPLIIICIPVTLLPPFVCVKYPPNCESCHLLARFDMLHGWHRHHKIAYWKVTYLWLLSVYCFHLWPPFPSQKILLTVKHLLVCYIWHTNNVHLLWYISRSIYFLGLYWTNQGCHCQI